MKTITKSWRWDRKKRGGGGSGSPPPKLNKLAAKPRPDARKEKAEKELNDVKTAVKDSLAKPTKQTVTTALGKAINFSGLDTASKQITLPREKSADEYYAETADYDGGKRPEEIKQRFKRFNGNDWWQSHYDFGNRLTSEELTGKYKHLFANAFYGAIERIGKDVGRDDSFKFSEHTKYDMQSILKRRVTKKPLSKCKSYLERELIVLWLDTSGSCQRFSALLNMIASVARKRHDVVVIRTADCIMDGVTDPSRKDNEFVTFTFPLDKDDSEALIRKGYSKYLIPPHLRTYSNGFRAWDIKLLHNQKLICLSDSDAYGHFYHSMPQAETVPEHFYFFDLYNYNREIGNDLQNCKKRPDIVPHIREQVKHYHHRINKTVEFCEDNMGYKESYDENGNKTWSVTTPWKASPYYTHLLCSDAAHLFDLLKTLK